MTGHRKWMAVLGFAAIVAAGALTGCVVRPYRAYGTVVYNAPPPPRMVMQPAAPGPGYAWVAGYWHWNGGQWVWMDGQWIAQRPGYVYAAPGWVQQGGGYVYVQGGWRSQPGGVVVNQPAGVYVQGQGGGGGGAVIVNSAPPPPPPQQGGVVVNAR